MLSALQFLASPVEMPSLKETSVKYLETAVSLKQDFVGREEVLKRIHKEYLPKIAEASPMLSLLEGDLMGLFDTTFSITLSSSMQLFGSEEEVEIAQYAEAYAKYWQALCDKTSKHVDVWMANLRGTEDQNRVLKNMTTKMHWLELGFNPSHNPALTIATPSPILTDLAITSIMSNWNTTSLGKRPAEAQLDFGEVVCEVSNTKSCLLAYAYTNGNLRSYRGSSPWLHFQ